MTDVRDEARALLAAATPGRWSVEGESVVNRALDEDDDNRWDIGEIYDDANRALIAAAPTLLAALCDELDARGAQVARLREVLADCIHGLMINDDAEASQAADTARAALAESEET